MKKKKLYLEWKVQYRQIKPINIGPSDKINQDVFETGSNVMINRNDENKATHKGTA